MHNAIAQHPLTNAHPTPKEQLTGNSYIYIQNMMFCSMECSSGHFVPAVLALHCRTGIAQGTAKAVTYRVSTAQSLKHW